MNTAEGFAVINWDADSHRGADHSDQRGTERGRRIEQARLSMVDNPPEHAGWGRLRGGWPQILAWGLNSAPPCAVDWDLPLVLDAGLVGVSGWLEEKAAKKHFYDSCDGAAVASDTEVLWGPWHLPWTVWYASR